MYILKFTVISVVINICVCCEADNISEDGRLDFLGLAAKYGFESEEYDVVTKDGYILKLFHVLGDKTRPVLLVHGLGDSSDTYIVRGNNSMTAALVRKGYDVWYVNTRGNRYSRRHVRLNPDEDKKFWEFSFHEIGIYDLPAIIDHILNQTGQDQLVCMGHSQGNTVFYALGSIRPEYNKKIKLFIALAPISFLSNLKGVTMMTIQLLPILDVIYSTFGVEEIFGWKGIDTAIFRSICTHELGHDLCLKRIIMAFAGEDLEDLEPEFLKTVLGHYFAGSSRTSLLHLMQSSLSKRFAQLDHGVQKNLDVYKARIPPDYDLSKVTMRVALVAAANDGLCSLKDVRRLKRLLPNVVDYKVLDRKKANHISFVWGLRMDKYLFPHILSLLEKYA